MTSPIHPSRVRCLAVACVALAVLGLGACGGGEDAGNATTTTAEVPAGADVPDLSDKDFEDLTDRAEAKVRAQDNTFVSAYITVKVGTTVTWTNKGRTEHNVLPVVDGAFTPIEVEDLEPEMSASITFDEVGDFPYYCSLHGTKTKGMVGAVRVVE